MSDRKFEFLQFAIEDAQELIRYTDTKTAIATTIIGAFIVGIFSIIDKIVKYCYDYTFIFWLLLVLFLIFLVLCTRVTARIIKPTINPVNNIEMGGLTNPKVKFYLSPNENKKWNYAINNSDHYKLGYSYKQYLDDICGAKDEDLIESLSFELLKISFIRNIKNDRFNQLVKLLVFSSILFCGFYILYTVQTDNIMGRQSMNDKGKTVNVISYTSNHEKEKVKTKIIYRKNRDSTSCKCCK